MIILGIETSCDETSAAIIEGQNNNITLKSNVTSTSLELHQKTGGIIPENAAREQLKYIIPVIDEALMQARVKLKDIDKIALTYGPGLIGSLLVGVETTKTIALVNDIPIIPVNHMIGHIYANWIDLSLREGTTKQSHQVKTRLPRSARNDEIHFPAIALVVSGGHTDLLLIKKHGDYQLLGGTRDDAAGECFDKCARLLGYGYPGGPKIAELAKKGNPKAIHFPRPMIGSQDFDFSFSGLKTSFFNSTKEKFSILRNDNPDSKAGWDQVAEDKFSNTDKQTVYDLCASLEDAIADVLVKKTLKAVIKHDARSILISGGVAANQKLRDTLEQRKKSLQLNANIFAPKKSLCTDNAAMIATAGYFNTKGFSWKNIQADPELYFN